MSLQAYWVQKYRILIFTRKRLNVNRLCLLLGWSWHKFISVKGETHSSVFVESLQLLLSIFEGFRTLKLNNSLTKNRAHIQQVIDSKMTVFIDSLRRSAKRALERIRVLNIEFPVHHHSARSVFALLNAKQIPMKAKVVTVFVEKPGEYFFFGR